QRSPRTFDGRFRTVLFEERRRFPGSGAIKDRFCGATAANSDRLDDWRGGFPVADKKKPSSSLRNTKVGCVEYLLADLITEISEFLLELTVPGPRSHMDYVL